MRKDSKFIEFEKYLSTLNKPSVILAFSEIESIIGLNLCKSAYKYPQYWYPSETHILPNLIVDCGYEIVYINQTENYIELKKVI